MSRTGRVGQDKAAGEALAESVIALRDEDRLCLVHDEEVERDPQIIRSLGLRREG